VSCQISDNGQGFDMAATPRGSGLQNMADRMEALGGSVEVQSSIGSGTSVTASLPLRVLELAS
jgi:signal transduction histidine kinase